MRRVGGILLLGALGGALAGFLALASFVALTLSQPGNPAGEAFAFGVLFSFAPALAGGLAGVLVGIFRPSVLGGAAIGLAATVLLILVWALLTAGQRGLVWGLSESSRFVAVFGAGPILVSATVAAWLRTRRERRRVALTPGQSV